MVACWTWSAGYEVAESGADLDLVIEFLITSLTQAGVSILISYGVTPLFVKLPIFTEFMENSTKFMKNSGLTKWTQNLR